MGKFIFINHLGATIVHYIAITSSMIKLITSFRLDPYPTSDHHLLILQMGYLNKLQKTVGMLQLCKSDFKGFRLCLWPSENMYVLRDTLVYSRNVWLIYSIESSLFLKGRQAHTTYFNETLGNGSFVKSKIHPTVASYISFLPFTEEGGSVLSQAKNVSRILLGIMDVMCNARSQPCGCIGWRTLLISYMVGIGYVCMKQTVSTHSKTKQDLWL